MNWKKDLTSFFHARALRMGTSPSLEELCYASGRDPRIWAQPNTYEDLIASILEQTISKLGTSVLELGCGCGFLAQGIAPRVGEYWGVDVAAAAVRTARSLALPNAAFTVADGSALAFRSNTFDVAIAYDVFTNLPSFSDCREIVGELVRVVRPGGRVLVGSVPDAATEQGFIARVREVQTDLAHRFGPVQFDNIRATHGKSTKTSILSMLNGWKYRFPRNMLRGAAFQPSGPPLDQGGISCFYFNRKEFSALDKKLDAESYILPLHRCNPYADFRFNIVYIKLSP